MEVKHLTRLIENGETQDVEFKQSFHSSQETSKTICGFANTSGGILIIGIKDNKEVLGVKEDIDILQQKISAANQNVSPAPLISVELHSVFSKKVIVVIIQKSPNMAYHTFQGAIYVRVGSTTKKLDGQTHLEFLRNKQILSFDETIDTEFSLKNIDKEKVEDYLAIRNQKDFLKTHSLQDFLISSKLAIKNGSLKIKNSAILLFGKEPIKFIPQVEIKLVKFSGTEPVNIIAHRLIQEDVVTAIKESMAFIEKKIDKSIEIKEIQREEKYEYPLKVVREAIVNAITHRDYFSKDAVQIYLFDDRIEITNPGSIPSSLPKEMFGTLSVQRNPILYRFLRDMGFVEGLGTGIPRMKNAMRKHGLNDPEFLFTESFFRIVLRNKKGLKKPIKKVKDLTLRQQRAIEYIKKHGSIKAKKYTEINKVSTATAVNDLNKLIDFGFIKKVGQYKGAYYILKEE